MRYPLVLHPDVHRSAVTDIVVEASRTAGRLALSYEIAGDLAALRLPAPAAPERADELWKTTCLEAFVKPVGGEAYVELNLYPSARWAAYAFDAYRDGMRNAGAIGDPGIVTRMRKGSLVLEAAADLSGLPPGPLRLGLSAVIEDIAGNKAYWALAHPPGKADFHHADCFAAEIPPTGGA